MKKVTVLIREPAQQYEGLRTSLGLLLESVEVKMVVLHHEVAALAGKATDEDAYEEYFDNMEFIDEMDGERFSNHPSNVEKYGFKPATDDDIAAMIRDADIVIPF
jgi:hypothetical protein